MPAREGCSRFSISPTRYSLQNHKQCSYWLNKQAITKKKHSFIVLSFTLSGNYTRVPERYVHLVLVFVYSFFCYSSKKKKQKLVYSLQLFNFASAKWFFSPVWAHWEKTVLFTLPFEWNKSQRFYMLRSVRRIHEGTALTHRPPDMLRDSRPSVIMPNPTEKCQTSIDSAQ